MKQSGSMLKLTHGFVAFIALSGFALAQQSTVGSGSPSPTTQSRPTPDVTTGTPTTSSSTAAPDVGTTAPATPSVPASTTPLPNAPAPATAPPASSKAAAPVTPENDAADNASTPATGTSSLPQTTLFPDNGGPLTNSTANDPLLQSGELPRGKVSLIGGLVTRIDNVRNRMTLQTFHGPKMKFIFDDRTRVFKDGTEVTQIAIHKGDRLYVDSQLNDGKIFARRINVRTALNPADASGQIISFDRRRNVVVLNDQLSGRPVSFRLPETPVIRKEDGVGTVSDLMPGALVQVQFVAGDNGNRGVAKDIKVLAAPGAAYTFFGRITHIDLRTNLMGLENRSDDKTYDIFFHPGQVQNMDELTVGAEATVAAKFNGRNYQAQSVSITRSASAAVPADKAAADKSDSDDSGFTDNDKVTSSDDEKDGKKHKKDKHEKSDKKDKKNKKDQSEDDDNPR